MQGVPLKLCWEGQQFSCVLRSSRPVNEITVMLELCNLSKPLHPVLVRDSDHVGKITRSQAAADCQLNALQQAPGAPFFFEPLDGNGRPPVFCVPTATSLANRKMSNNEPLRCQRMCRVSRHTFSSSPARPQTIGKIIRAPSFWPKRQAEAAGRSSG
jgi:hypothetical protein